MIKILVISAIVILIGILLLMGPLRGSLNSDFEDIAIDETNPLEPCPDSPNCIRLTLSSERTAEELYAEGIQAFTQMDPMELNPDEDLQYIHTVFRIPVFGFKDDMELQITESDGGSFIHIRSASRVGESDLGENRRRVNQFLSRFEA